LDDRNAEPFDSGADRCSQPWPKIAKLLLLAIVNVFRHTARKADGIDRSAVPQRRRAKERRAASICRSLDRLLAKSCFTDSSFDRLRTMLRQAQHERIFQTRSS